MKFQSDVPRAYIIGHLRPGKFFYDGYYRYVYWDKEEAERMAKVLDGRVLEYGRPHAEVD